MAMFRSEADVEAEWSGTNGRSEFGSASPTPLPQQPEGADGVDDSELFLTEESALFELPGIPLYFPTSYSLVKPYVKGFDVNSLDAPLLKRVEIDSTWKAK